MSGVKVVRYLLANSAPLTAVVAAAKIAAGPVPQDTELPAIAVTQISGVQTNTVAMNAAAYQVRERIQVTAYAKTYPQMKAILALVRAALPLSRGTVNGVAVDSILPDSDGPDLFDHEAGAHEQSIDFIVKFSR